MVQDSAHGLGTEAWEYTGIRMAFMMVLVTIKKMQRQNQQFLVFWEAVKTAIILSRTSSFLGPALFLCMAGPATFPSVGMRMSVQFSLLSKYSEKQLVSTSDNTVILRPGSAYNDLEVLLNDLEVLLK